MTRDDGSGTIGGRNDDSPYASGRRKTLSPPKINPPPMDKISTYKKKKENIMRSLPPAIYCHGAE